MAKASIGLSELIAQVRRELSQPPDLNDPIPIMSVDEIELEIRVAVSKSIEGGIHIQVVELGGIGQKEDVHTVRLKLTPLLTREQRLEELKKSPEWPKILVRQMADTYKGVVNDPRPGNIIK